MLHISLTGVSCLPSFISLSLSRSPTPEPSPVPSSLPTQDQDIRPTLSRYTIHEANIDETKKAPVTNEPRSMSPPSKNPASVVAASEHSDNPNFKTRLGVPCATIALGKLDCDQFGVLGMTDQEVQELKDNCPCACNTDIDCGEGGDEKEKASGTKPPPLLKEGAVTPSVQPSDIPSSLTTSPLPILLSLFAQPQSPLFIFPTPKPSQAPTSNPTATPSVQLTDSPTLFPTLTPSARPTLTPHKQSGRTPIKQLSTSEISGPNVSSVKKTKSTNTLYLAIFIVAAIALVVAIYQYLEEEKKSSGVDGSGHSIPSMFRSGSSGSGSSDSSSFGGSSGSLSLDESCTDEENGSGSFTTESSFESKRSTDYSELEKIVLRYREEKKRIILAT